MHFIYLRYKQLQLQENQGSQFTSEAFTGVLLTHGIRISMDGKGRALDGDAAKHGIKRVWRFFRNGLLEIASVQLSLAHLLAPRNAPLVILLDWTVHGQFQTLAAALPRDGLCLPLRLRRTGRIGRC